MKIAHAREFFINKEGKSVDLQDQEAIKKTKSIRTADTFHSSLNKTRSNRESNLLDSESSTDSEDENEIRHTGTGSVTFDSNRWETRHSSFHKSGNRTNRLSFSLGYRSRSDSGTRKKRKDYILPGAKITAYSTSIFTRLRLLDGIDF